MADYSAYELEEGEALEDLETICGHMTADGSFTDTTVPTSTDVHRWFNLSRAAIAARLESNGYASTQTNLDVIAILQDINVLDVAIRCELSHPLSGPGQPNERFLELKARRDEMLLLLEGNALANLGAITQPEGVSGQYLTATGISIARKQAVEDDIDYVQPRFKRGFGSNSRDGSRTYGDTDVI